MMTKSQQLQLLNEYINVKTFNFIYYEQSQKTKLEDINRCSEKVKKIPILLLQL